MTIDISSWSDMDGIIRCHKLCAENTHKISPPLCNVLNCDCCKKPIVGTRITKEKQGMPRWHIVCHDCYNELQKMAEIQWAGQINNETMELPYDPET
jgi:hypothetical protein